MEYFDKFFHPFRSANIDERAIGDRATWDPSDLVLRLGVAKAEALLPSLRAEAERGELTTTMLLTGDQGVCVCVCVY